MPQRVIVVFACSLCEGESTEPGFITEFKISYDKTQMSLDACKVCFDAEPMQTILGAAEREKRGPGRPPKVLERQAVAPIIMNSVDPHDPKRGANQTGSFSCPEDGCRYTSPTAQGVGVHRRHVHGYQSPAFLAKKEREARLAAAR